MLEQSQVDRIDRRRQTREVKKFKRTSLKSIRHSIPTYANGPEEDGDVVNLVAVWVAVVQLSATFHTNHLERFRLETRFLAQFTPSAIFKGFSNLERTTDRSPGSIIRPVLQQDVPQIVQHDRTRTNDDQGARADQYAKFSDITQENRPLRTDQHKNKGVLLDPPPLQVGED